MISVIINKDLNKFSIKITGHANYADYGNDIVCASVSTAAIMTANLIEKINLSYNITNLICEDGNFLLEVNVENSIIKDIFENLEYTIVDISKQYPKNIKIKN